jgi:excisionase family DNA binding protein
VTASRDRQKGRVTAPGVDRTCYSVRELACSTGLSMDTVYRGIHDGRIPHFRLCGEYRIPASWLNEQIAAAESAVAS